MDTIHESIWKKCSTCKKPILYGVTYWHCSVSTCNRKRTALVFCTVSCWDAHIGLLRHRDSWAVEEKAPSLAAWQEAFAKGGDWPPKAEREKVAKVEDVKPSGLGGPKVIRRSSS